MKILLLVTSSISVKVMNKMIDRLHSDGHELKTYFTENAAIMYHHYHDVKIEEKTPSYEFRNEFDTYLWNGSVPHIDDVNWADVALVCPADFNIIGKMSNGIADTFITSCLAAWLGTDKPIYIAESMNTNMFRNPSYQRNIANLCIENSNLHIIQPTVKKLACGDYGIGGLADINTIVNIVNGHVWTQPIRTYDLYKPEQYPVSNDDDTLLLQWRYEPFRNFLPKWNEPGAFGAKRRFDRHEGVDIYCNNGSKVYAVEDGEVVDSYQYTGKNADCEWWNDTWCIKVKGMSGVVTYGELRMPNDNKELNPTENYPSIGTHVNSGDYIGRVGQVLKDGKRRSDIRHHNTSMLHIELRTESCHIDGWKLDGDRDKRLLDPTPYLKDKRMTEHLEVEGICPIYGCQDYY